MTDEYGLSEMRVEHIPSRIMSNSEIGWLNYHDGNKCPECQHKIGGGGWRWSTSRFVYGRNEPCDEQTARLYIDAARRKALHKAGFSVRDFPSSEGVYLIFVPDWPDGPESRHDSLRAAYAAVFPKEAARAE